MARNCGRTHGLRVAAGIAVKEDRTSVLQPKDLDSTKSHASSKENPKIPKEYSSEGTSFPSWEKRNSFANIWACAL